MTGRIVGGLAAIFAAGYFAGGLRFAMHCCACSSSAQAKRASKRHQEPPPVGRMGCEGPGHSGQRRDGNAVGLP